VLQIAPDEIARTLTVKGTPAGVKEVRNLLNLLDIH
jgi:hypothetical protein